MTKGTLVMALIIASGALMVASLVITLRHRSPFTGTAIQPIDPAAKQQLQTARMFILAGLLLPILSRLLR